MAARINDEALATPSRSGFRAELNGLRGVAIAMVVAYHVFFGRVSGGVDIFLMISAFLLTNSFVNRIEAGRPLAVVRYWGRVFKRLLPPAAIVIATSVAVMQLVFPPNRWRVILDEALASLTYQQNWLLARSAVDYYALDRTQASPLQHFWSLSIQGQVFVIWPLLIALGVVVMRVTGRSVRTSLGLVFGMVFIGSFSFSVWATAANQIFAYFDTLTRLWEFAFGSLLALVLPLLEQRVGYGPDIAPEQGRAGVPRSLLGWAGIIAMLSVGAVVDVEGAFPGYIAGWPLAAAGLVIVAGRTASAWSVDRLLATPPLQWLGDISYAFYLVHWPLLVVWLTLQDRPQAGLLEGFGLIAVSMLLAAVLTQLVDRPIRRSSWLEASSWRQLGVIVTALLVGLTPTVITNLEFEQHRQNLAQNSANNSPGAGVLTGQPGDLGDPEAPTLPLLHDLPFDFVEFAADCQEPWAPTEAPLAARCSATPWGDPDKLIVAVGSSRTQQMSAALLPLARASGYKVVALLLGGCPFGSDDEEQCGDWNPLLVDYLTELRPRAVFTSTSEIVPFGHETILPGTPVAIQRLSEAGVDVIGLRDQPRLPATPICEQIPPSQACTMPTGEIYQEIDINAGLTEFAVGSGQLFPIDLIPWICPAELCQPTIGNVHVYIDVYHLSQTYAATLAPMLDAELQAAGWRW